MKELDALLTAYLDSHYQQADATEKAAFRSLLELPDPELVGYLLHSKRPESEPESRVVDLILGRTAS
jgi:succinate dehydrogenase flavin-adding protein (antitoxin of CptAB toxin-antitoxin module)